LTVFNQICTKKSHGRCEMSNVFGLPEAPFRGLDLGWMLLAFLVAVFIYVMTRNYLRLRCEKFTPDLLEGEKALDDLKVDGLLKRTHTVLTNRRVLQLRLSWFLSRRKQFAVSLRDLRSVAWQRRANWYLLLAAFLCLGGLNPLALLLFLLAMEAKMYSVRFVAPVNEMPWIQMGTRSFLRRRLMDFTRFFRNAQATWAHVRSERAVGEPTAQAVTAPETDTDFLWGRPVWVYVLLFLVLGIVQRFVEPHLSFDDYVFTPLYLGLPVAVAQRSLRDAVWAAIVGVVALITVKFPNFALLLPPVGDGRSPLVEQYVLVLVAATVAALIAGVVARRMYPALSFLVVFLWLGFAGLHMPNVFFDLGLYAKVALAMAAAILLTWAERDIGHLYGATS
jgi:hypothetical protein